MRVTLDQPDRLNAFTETMAVELRDALYEGGKDDETLAIVVTGAGTAFCAGMDLSGSGNPFGLSESDLAVPDTLRSADQRQLEPGDGRDLGGIVAMAAWHCPKLTVARWITPQIDRHPDRPLPKLLGVLPRCCHDSHPSVE
jgi:enoyl-CoA hydratase/carnithine racemase